MYHIRGPQEWVDIINGADNKDALIKTVDYYNYQWPKLSKYKKVTEIQQLALELDFKNFKRGLKLWKKAQREEDF